MRNYGTNLNWNRAFWAPRTDAPLWAVAVRSGPAVVGIMPPPAHHSDGAMKLLTMKLLDRCERPHLGPGQRRRKFSLQADSEPGTIRSEDGDTE